MAKYAIYEGEAKGITVNILEADGSPFNLTGYDVSWKAVNGSIEVLKTLGEGISAVDLTNGELLVSLSSADTAVAGRYEVEIRISADPDSVLTVYRGTLVVVSSLFGGGNG